MTGSSPARPSVQVLATTTEGTRCALLRAKQLTEGLDARILLLEPRLTSFATPFTSVTEKRVAAFVDEQRALAATVGVHVTVLFCAGERFDDVVHSMPPDRSSVIVVGGRSRAWWPSREQRMVRRLAAAGYHVVFAEV